MKHNKKMVFIPYTTYVELTSNNSKKETNINENVPTKNENENEEKNDDVFLTNSSTIKINEKQSRAHSTEKKADEVEVQTNDVDSILSLPTPPEDFFDITQHRRRLPIKQKKGREVKKGYAKPHQKLNTGIKKISKKWLKLT